MHTDRPASVSTSAAVAPPGPEPITTTSNSGTGDLRVAPTARLHVAGVSDHAPAGEIAVASVLRRAVRRFARVLEQEVLQLGLPIESKVVAERSDALAVHLLPPAHRPVPFTFRLPERTLDARAPRELLEPRQRQ